MHTEEQILEAKLNLYNILLNIPENIISDNEVDIMYKLSIDIQIKRKLMEEIRKNGNKKTK